MANEPSFTARVHEAMEEVPLDMSTAEAFPTTEAVTAGMIAPTEWSYKELETYELVPPLIAHALYSLLEKLEGAGTNASVAKLTPGMKLSLYLSFFFLFRWI